MKQESLIKAMVKCVYPNNTFVAQNHDFYHVVYSNIVKFMTFVVWSNRRYYKLDFKMLGRFFIRE